MNVKKTPLNLQILGSWALFLATKHVHFIENCPSFNFIGESQEHGTSRKRSWGKSECVVT